MVIEEELQKNKTDNKLNLKYGFPCWRPAFLRCFVNIRWIVFFISMCHLLQNATNGIQGVTITTLEKRFRFSSLQTSLIASAYEFGQVPGVVFIMLFGHRLCRPLTMGLGMTLVLAGCLFMMLPQFLMEPYHPDAKQTFPDQVNSSTSLCRNYSLALYKKNCQEIPKTMNHYLFLFIFARFLIGLGATPILTVGLTFINDSTNVHSFAFYSGVYNAMSIVGPGLGLVLASFMLKSYVHLQLPDNIYIDSQDSRWIGNWWACYPILSILILLTAPPLFGYSDHVPETSTPKKEKEELIIIEQFNFDKELKNNKINKKNDLYNHKNGDMKTEKKKSVSNEQSSPLRSISLLLSNLLFLIACLFSICDMLIVMGFNAFGPKIFENFLSFTPTTAGLIFGSVLLPAGAIGTILGGVIISKFKMTSIGIILTQMILSIIVFFLLPTILIHCPQIGFHGITVNQNNYTSCSNNCHCDMVVYQPICSHDDIQFFSGCHAGCKNFFKQNNSQLFFDCSCISKNYDYHDFQASLKPCTSSSCPLAILFLLLFALVVTIVFICFTMNTALIFRFVQVSQATAAVSIQILSTKLLGTIPGPIIFGFALDKSCALYDYNSCDPSHSNCIFIHVAQASWNILKICLVAKVINTIGMIIMYSLKRKRLKDNIETSQRKY